MLVSTAGKCSIFKRTSTRFRNNALMQEKSYNYNNFMIFFAKYFCSINFIFTLDL